MYDVIIIGGNIAGIVAAKYVNKELKSLELYQKLLQSKIKNLTREYQIKCSMMKSDDSFLTKYRMGHASLYFFNKYFPGIFERLFPKLTEKDKKIFKSLGETYKIL